MSEVAATNPYAWFPRPLSAEHLSTPTAGNRMVGYPYTKQAVSIMDVDMAATVIVASHAKADELGVPAERRVYLRGWCYATDPVYLAEHPTCRPRRRWPPRAPRPCAAPARGSTTSPTSTSTAASPARCTWPAMRSAWRPTTRGLTVTGGLPFSGGAGSNYMLHSIATMVDVLRADPGALGLVSGVGMHMTKHVYGVYSPPPRAHPPDQPHRRATRAPPPRPATPSPTAATAPVTGDS